MKSVKQHQSSESQPLDRLGALLERFRVRASLFHAGALCGVTRFDAQPGRAFLHVLQRGRLRLRHPAASGLPQSTLIEQPTLLLYPRPLRHDFHTAALDGADFVCATLDFDGGDAHPLVRALPPLLRWPLAELPGVTHTLALLFDETAQPRCGARLLADRLFEVLLLQLLRALLAAPQATPPGLLQGLADARLAPLLLALHERPGEAWTLAAMADTAGLSRSLLAERFRRQLGETPMAYLTRWRLLLVQQGLAQGRPLKLLADELGYGSAAALARVMRQQLGEGPRALRGRLCDPAASR